MLLDPGSRAHIVLKTTEHPAQSIHSVTYRLIRPLVTYYDDVNALIHTDLYIGLGFVCKHTGAGKYDQRRAI